MTRVFRTLLAIVGVLLAATAGALIAFTILWLLTGETELQPATEGAIFYIGGAFGLVLGARLALPLFRKSSH